MKNKIITIDGPAGSGKERIAKYLSKKWNLYHLDSGILYRRISFIILKNKINFKNSYQINRLFKKTKLISPRNNKKLRTEKIGKLASKIATIKKIREFINIQQKKIVNN